MVKSESLNLTVCNIITCMFATCIDSDGEGPMDPNELVPRRVGEVIGSTVGTLASLVNYPIG